MTRNCRGGVAFEMAISKKNRFFEVFSWGMHEMLASEAPQRHLGAVFSKFPLVACSFAGRGLEFWNTTGYCT